MEENEYVQKIHELEQELKIRIEDNAELYTNLCNALMQLNEANDCINSAQISLRGYMLKINEYKKKWGVK